MVWQEQDGTWWLGSELGEACPPKRQITEARARELIAEYEVGNAHRLEAIEYAKTPEYAI